MHGDTNNVVAVQSMEANLIGTFAAAWDDAGLHNEIFWLGWATVTQYGWTSQKPTIEQSTADFIRTYGKDVFHLKGNQVMVIHLGKE